MNIHKKITAAFLATALLATSAVPVMAQPADAQVVDREVVERDRDDGFDWGLLGLLGLLGLIPRKRHDTVVHHDTTRTPRT